MSHNQSHEAIKLKLNELYEDAKSKGTITRDEVAAHLMAQLSARSQER